ncbi:MAG: Crp/Fnr family transcriptional regulator [Nitrospirae bacterium]|nr:MAG: Crp/Fnr family transcriptional regulator [Nitrospirota bacterium]
MNRKMSRNWITKQRWSSFTRQVLNMGRRRQQKTRQVSTGSPIPLYPCEQAPSTLCQHCFVGQALKDSDRGQAMFLADRYVHRYKARQVIFHEGNPVSFIHLLREGVAKLSVISREGVDRVLHLVSSDPVPCLLLDKLALNRPVHSVTCETLSPCTVYSIRKSTFHQLLTQEETLVQHILHLLSEEAEAYLAKFRDEHLRPAKERLIDILLRLADLYGVRDASHPTEPRFALSRQELASLIGVTRETIARLLTELRKSRYIELRENHIVILNKDGLQRLIDIP